MNALNRLSDRLADMAINNLVAKAFGGAIGGGGLNFFGLGGNTSAGITGVAPYAAPGNYVAVGHTGGIGSELTGGRYVHPAPLRRRAAPTQGVCRGSFL